MNLRPSPEGVAPLLPMATVGEMCEVTVVSGERIGGRDNGFLFFDFFDDFPVDFLFLVCIVSLHKVKGRLYCKNRGREVLCMCLVGRRLQCTNCKYS